VVGSTKKLNHPKLKPKLKISSFEHFYEPVPCPLINGKFLDDIFNIYTGELGVLDIKNDTFFDLALKSDVI